MSWSFQGLLGKIRQYNMMGLTVLYWGAVCNATKVWAGCHLPKIPGTNGHSSCQGEGPGNFVKARA